MPHSVPPSLNHLEPHHLNDCQHHQRCAIILFMVAGDPLIPLTTPELTLSSPPTHPPLTLSRTIWITASTASAAPSSR